MLGAHNSVQQILIAITCALKPGMHGPQVPSNCNWPFLVPHQESSGILEVCC